MTSVAIDDLDGVRSSKAFKTPCRCATTANITLSGLQTIDGVTVAEDDRVLVKDQSTGANNGIYKASAGTWTRTPDFDGTRDVVSGTQVHVTEGTANGDKSFALTTADPITIGTTALAFASVGTTGNAVYDSFLTKSGNYTVVAADEGAMILVDASGGAVTITLPSIASVGDFKIGVAKTDSSANAVTIARGGADTIDGATSATLAAQHDTMTLAAKSGTTNWLAVAFSGAFALTAGTAGYDFATNGATRAFRAPTVQALNVLCPHENLTAARASNSTVTIAADAVTLRTTSGGTKRFTGLSETLNIASSGANGLDTGAEAGNTWYHIWAIGKEDGTLDGLLSASATAPTMPSGYTYKGYLGAVRNDGSSNFIDFAQVGARVAFTGVNVLTAGTATAATSVSLASAVPPTAKTVTIASAVISTSGTQDSQVIIGASSSGLGAVIVGGATSAGAYNSYHTNEVILATAQTIWYNLSGANRQVNLDVRGWGY